METGRIRLAAYGVFRSHPDDRRKDASEGLFSVERMFAPPAGSQAEPLYWFSEGDAGARCCAAAQAAAKKVRTKYRRTYITIVNTPLLAAQIARELPGFVGGWESLCDYGGARNLLSEIDGEKAAAVHKMIKAGQPPPRAAVSSSVLFAKALQFAEELEYQFIRDAGTLPRALRRAWDCAR